MIELFLIAGETFDDGKLPDIGSLSWILRRSEKDVTSALQKLAEIGTVTLSGDNAVVTNFERYQNTNQTAYERVKRYRNRNKDNANDNGHDNAVDNANDNGHDIKMITVDKDIDKDIDIDKELIKRELKRETPPAPKTVSEPKQKYGQFHNVLLTNTEYAKLCEQFSDADTRIENFSASKAAKGYTYKSDYAAILTWARKDAAENKAKTAVTPKAQPKKTYTFSEVLAMEGARQ